jgi:hypothetical protein
MTLEILVKPAKFKEAIRRLGKKKPVAKKLNSREWANMPTNIRERAYFTSNVESMKFLNRSKKMLNDYLSGARETVTTPDGRRVSALKKTSRADFVYEMQRLAKQEGLGNVLPPGEDMSRDLRTRMKDITSETRLTLIFDTQTQQAQAYGYYKQGQDPAILDAYPAQRFIRAEQRKVPRPLHKSNRNEVRRKDDMDFWLRMNDQSIGGLGVPFGPWGFNSGMDVEDVRRDKAIQMGLIAKNEQVLPPDDTFNKGVKAAADVEPEFLEKFMNKMGDEAINYGETVELSQRMSDVPPPAPAKPVRLKADRYEVAEKNINKLKSHKLTAEEEKEMFGQEGFVEYMNTSVLDTHEQIGFAKVPFKMIKEDASLSKQVEWRWMEKEFEMDHHFPGKTEAVRLHYRKDGVGVRERFKGVHEKVSLSKLRASSQAYVDTSHLTKILKRMEKQGSTDVFGRGTTAPSVVKWKGEYILYDGHHRATAATLLGETDIIAEVLDLDK